MGLAEFTAIWDTGATGSVITAAVASACGLAPISFTQVHGVGGVHTAPVYLVNIHLQNSVRFAGFTVTEGQLPLGCDVLIGMDIISLGDFTITNQSGETIFTFRVPSMARTDYVREENRKAQPAPPVGGSNRGAKGKRHK